MPQALAETITHSPSESEEAAAIRADALRAESWAGEPFLRPDEDPDVVLAFGTARRRALDDGLAEVAAGCESPSPEWKVRYALLLGLNLGPNAFVTGAMSTMLWFRLVRREGFAPTISQFVRIGVPVALVTLCVASLLV